MYVAVVCRVDGAGKVVEKSNSGPWTSFIGTSEKEVVDRAVKQLEISNGRTNVFAGSYRVLVGELTQKVEKPVLYKLVPLTKEVKYGREDFPR